MFLKNKSTSPFPDSIANMESTISKHLYVSSQALTEYFIFISFYPSLQDLWKATIDTSKSPGPLYKILKEKLRESIHEKKQK